MNIATWFSPDPVGIMFLRFILPTIALVSFLSRHYYGKLSRQFLLLAALLAVGFTGLSFTTTWYGFMVFWEMLTLTGYFLIRPSSPGIARRYLAIQLGGAGVLFLAAAYTISLTGSSALGAVPSEVWPMFFAGVGVKVGLLGVHFWLPEAHGAAHAPASALLSGVMVKAGLLAYARVGMTGYAPMVWFGFGMLFWGALRAFMETDLKQLLAYSTVSQLGYMMLVLGSGSELYIPAVAGYAFGHAIAKGGLFILAGLIEKQLGTRQIHHLRGLGKCCRDLMVMLLVLMGSLAGLPLTFGFFAKGGVKYALASGSLVQIGVVGGGVVSLLYVFRLWWLIWSGESELSLRRAELRLPFTMALITLSVVVFGVFPVWPVNYVALDKLAGGYYSWSKLLGVAGLAAISLVIASGLSRAPMDKVRSHIEEAFNRLELSLHHAVAAGSKALRRLHTGDLSDYLLYVFVGLVAFLMYGYLS